MNIFAYISETIRSQFELAKEKADDVTRNIITNFANCAGASVDTVQETHRDQLQRCFDHCFASSHNASGNDVDKFEKVIIKCMCQCARA